MLEHYYFKGFGILEGNSNNLKNYTNLEKSIIHAEETNDSEYVIILNTTIPSISNTLKNFWLHSSLQYYNIQTKYNDKEEIINRILSKYVEPLLNDINHPALLQ